MADLRRVGLNNQKRGVGVSIGDACPTEDNVLFNLPQNVMVTSVAIVTKEADTSSGATMDVEVDGTVIGDELKVDAVGVDKKDAAVYFDTGGAVSIKPGSTAPGGDGSVRLVVEYIELDKLSGEYTD